MFKMAILGAGAIAHKMSNTISQMENVEPYIIADVNIEKSKGAWRSVWLYKSMRFSR